MIPKILHTVWIGNKVPKLDFRNTWDVFNDWEIFHWDDDKLKEFDLSLVEGPTLKSDYARLLILQKYGGVYADMDMMFFKPIDKFLIHKSFLTYQFERIEFPTKILPKGWSLNQTIKNKISVFDYYAVDQYLNNNLMGSEPNSKLINTYINIFEEDKHKPIEERFSWTDYGAGPSMTTHVAKQFVELDGYTIHHDEVSVYNATVFHPTNYMQYQEAVSQRNFDDVINEQIEKAKLFGSYAVHFQRANEVDDYVNS